MKLRSFLALLAAGLFLMSCHSSSQSAAPAELVPALDVNAQLTFKESTNSTAEAAKAQADISCLQKQSESPDAVIYFNMDPNLRMAQTELREVKSSVSGELITTNLKNMYLGKDFEDKDRLSTKILSISSNQQGEFLTEPFEYFSTCESSGNAIRQKCDPDTINSERVKILEDHMNASGVSHMQDRANQLVKCSMASNEDTQTSYQVGTYKLRRGQILSAIHQITEVKGVIVCQGRRIGHGKMRMDRIFSHDVISVGQLVSCSGTEILTGRTFFLDGPEGAGTLPISSRHSEILEAPFR